MGEDERNDVLFLMDEKGGSHKIIVDDLIDLINIAAQPEKYPEYYGGEITFDTDTIKDTFAYRLLFGKYSQKQLAKASRTADVKMEEFEKMKMLRNFIAWICLASGVISGAYFGLYRMIYLEIIHACILHDAGVLTSAVVARTVFSCIGAPIAFFGVSIVGTALFTLFYE